MPSLGIELQNPLLHSTDRAAAGEDGNSIARRELNYKSAPRSAAQAQHAGIHILPPNLTLY